MNARTVTLDNFYKACVAELVERRAKAALQRAAGGARADERDVRSIVRSCAVEFERVRRDAPARLAIDGLDCNQRAHQRLLAHRALVVVRAAFDRAVAQCSEE